MIAKRFLLTALLIAIAPCSVFFVAQAAPAPKSLSTVTPPAPGKNARIVWSSCYGGGQSSDAWCCVVYETGPHTVSYACNTLGFLVSVAQDAQYRSSTHAGQCPEQQLVTVHNLSAAKAARQRTAIEAAAKAFVNAYQDKSAP